MLIAPRTPLKGGVERLPIPARPHLEPVEPVPDYNQMTNLKLAVGHAFVYIKVHDTGIELIESFTLDEFSIKDNQARWTFLSDSGVITQGTFSSVNLQPRLSVKLVTPIVVLPSKGMLRTTFSFRIDPGYRILSRNQFRNLIGQGG